jgi:hypothetical protein
MHLVQFDQSVHSRFSGRGSSKHKNQVKLFISSLQCALPIDTSAFFEDKRASCFKDIMSDLVSEQEAPRRINTEVIFEEIVEKMDDR